MACYEYNGIKYKEEELRDLLSKKPSKTRRVLELQSDLFQKSRGRTQLAKETELETIDYDDEGTPLPGPVYGDIKGNQFLQLLNKDGNWVKFFIQSIVQDSAKKDYEKVLFPTGETASKVEGHATLAGEIKEIDEAIDNPNVHFLYEEPDDPGTYNFNNVDFPHRPIIYSNSKKEFIEKLRAYKDNIKTQGVEKLRPIESFYSNRVTNILKKFYGKNNIEVITDEHGNTWNEVTINSSIISDPILLRLQQPEIKQKANVELNNKLLQVLKDVGVETNEVTYQEMKDKAGVDALGLTQILAKQANIEYVDTRDLLTIPEEASHVFVAMMNGTAWQNRLFNALKRNDTYKTILGAEYDTYNELYKGNEAKLIEEAAGKAVSKTFVNKFTELENQPKGIQSILQKFWNKVMEMINKIPFITLKNEIDILTNTITEQVLTDKFEGSLENLDKESLYFQVKPTLDKNAKTLDKIIATTTKNIKYYETRHEAAKARGDKGFKTKLEEDRELLKTLHEAYNEAQFLDGINAYLEYTAKEISSFQKAAEQIAKSVQSDITLDEIGDISSRLKGMRYTIDSHRPILDDVFKELVTEKYNNPDNAEIAKEYADIVKESQDVIEELDVIYYNTGVIVVSQFLEPLLGDRNDTTLLESIMISVGGEKLNLLDIREALVSTEGDINFKVRFLDALAESPKDIHNLIDQAVKVAKFEAEQLALDDRKDLLLEHKKLQDAGLTSDFVMEKDSSGNHTGYLVRQFDWSTYDTNSKKFFTQFNKELLDNFNVNNYQEFKDLEDDLKLTYGDAEYVIQNNKIIAFFESNRLSKSETNKVIVGKSEQWLYFNARQDSNGNWYLSKNVNSQYADIQKDSIKKEYYDSVLNLKYKLDQSLPEGQRTGALLPQIRKDSVERFKSALKGRSLADIGELAREWFQVLEDEDERGVKYELTNDPSKPVKFLPIYYVNKLKDPKHISTDITGSMILYSIMARDYQKMNEIVDTLELSKEIIGQLDIARTEGGKPVIQSINSLNRKIVQKVFKPTGKSNIADMLDDYFASNLYGERKKDEGTLFGGKVDRAKVADSLGRYTAITQLAGNVLAGTANILQGKSMMRIEGIAREYVNYNDLLYGDKIYGKELMPTIGTIGSVDHQGRVTGKYSKLSLWNEKNDTLQDYRQFAREIDPQRKTLFGRLFNISTLFFINRTGEHYMQSRVSIALANNYRYDKSQGKFVFKDKFYRGIEALDNQRRQEIKNITTDTKKDIKAEIKVINSKYEALKKEASDKLDSQWKEMTNYWDAHETKDNKITLKPEFKDNSEDRYKFTNKVDFVNKRLHGIYNDVDKSAIQRYAIGRLVMMFRKWMIPYFNRRYGKKQFNYEGDLWTEGYYTTVGNFIKKAVSEMRAGQFSLAKNWNTLSTQEKANFRRSFVEFAHLMAFSMLAFIVGAAGDASDDDIWALNFMAYEYNRMITEIGTTTPTPMALTEGLKILKSPAASVNTLQDFINFLYVDTYFETIQSGKFEDKYKIQKYIIKVTPLRKPIYNLMSPEESLIYYQGSR